jgi:hypothetical protein
MTASFGCQMSPADQIQQGVSAVPGPEFALDMPVPRPGGEQVEVQDATSDGTRFQLVWRERSDRLWAASFGLGGEPLEPVSHALGINASQGAAIEFHGTGYALAWNDRGSVFLSLMDPSGQLLGNPLTVAEPDTTAGEFLLGEPDLAVAGDRILVVWSVYFDFERDRIRGQVFDLSLTPTTVPFDIAVPADHIDIPRVASDGTNYLVGWNDNNTIRASRVTQGGLVVDGSSLTVSPAGHNAFNEPTLAFGERQYIVGWRADSLSRVFAKRYTTSLVSLDPSPVELTQSANAFISRPGHKAVFDGVRFVVSWIGMTSTTSRVRASWIDLETGSPDPVGGIEVDEGRAASPTAMTSAGGVTMMARSDAFALADGDGVVLTTQPRPFALQYNSQAEPRMCKTTSGHFAVWIDDRVEAGFYAARFAADGTLIGQPQRVSELSSDFAGVAKPTLACGDSVHLVAWRAGKHVFAARIGSDGTALDATPIDLGFVSPEGEPAAASAGDSFLVTWSDGADIFGRRVSEDGALLDPGAIPISTAAGAQVQPALAFGNGVYLAAWHDQRNVSKELFGARIDVEGNVLDPGGLALGTTAIGPTPIVVAGPANFLVAWRPLSFHVHATVVDVAGDLVTPETVVLDPGPTGSLAAAWDGETFAVLAETQSRDIRLTRLDSTGAPFDVDGVVLADGLTEPAGAPAVAATAPGELLVMYERDRFLGDRTISRLFLQRNDLAGDGGACQSGVLCRSGYCVDGVCCDQPCGGGDLTDCQTCRTALGAATDGVCGPASHGTVCRPASGDCDVAEVCSGSATVCPADAPAADGADCSDGDPCTTGETCTVGECGGGDDVDCSTTNPCEVGTCDSATGECIVSPVADGTTCPPADQCMLSAECQAGSCQPDETVTCPPPPACHSSDGCNPATGECDVSPLPDGTDCPDGTCQSGICVPTPDAGVPDASPDAGDAPPDAGVADAAAPPADATPDNDGAPGAMESGGGGGCQIAGHGDGTLLLLLVAIAALAGLRRRLDGSVELVVGHEALERVRSDLLVGDRDGRSGRCRWAPGGVSRPDPEGGRFSSAREAAPPSSSPRVPARPVSSQKQLRSGDDQP